MKNPIWTKDEMILALDLYFRIRQESISPSHPEVVELSEVMNNLQVHPKELREMKFRNPNGVALRLANYKSVDPDYIGTGMSNGGKQVQLVWEEFSNNRIELAQIASTIRNSTEYRLFDPISDEEDDFPEGKVLYRIHKSRERNSKVVREKKTEAINNSSLICEVCGFDFEKKYGNIGKGYIECHHNKPISEYKEGHRTRKSDLRLVCANCHRMLHRKRPWVKVEELKVNS